MVRDSPDGIVGYKTLLREGTCAAVFCGGGEDSVSFSEFGCGALEDDAGYVHAGYVGEWWSYLIQPLSLKSIRILYPGIMRFNQHMIVHQFRLGDLIHFQDGSQGFELLEKF